MTLVALQSNIAPVCAAPINSGDLLANWIQTDNPRDGYTGTWSQAGSEVKSPDFGAIVSDFSTTGDFVFSGSFRTEAQDDDIIGFIWGWQNADNNYRFGWDAFDFNNGHVDWLGTNGIDNHPTASGVRGMRVLEEALGINTFHSQQGTSPTAWSRNTLYDFSVSMVGNDFTVLITEGASTLLDVTFNDDSFPTGRIGLYTSSQPNVYFSNIDFTDNSTQEGGSIPAPTTLALLGIGLAGLGYRRKKSSKGRN